MLTPYQLYSDRFWVLFANCEPSFKRNQRPRLIYHREPSLLTYKTPSIFYRKNYGFFRAITSTAWSSADEFYSSCCTIGSTFDFSPYLNTLDATEFTNLTSLLDHWMLDANRTLANLQNLLYKNVFDELAWKTIVVF